VPKCTGRRSPGVAADGPRRRVVSPWWRGSSWHARHFRRWVSRSHSKRAEIGSRNNRSAKPPDWFKWV